MLPFDFKQLQQLSSIKSYGNSMYPFFVDGDIIHLKKVSFSRISVDDFITIYKNKTFITHRVVYKALSGRGNFLITKGDYNKKTDGKIKPDQVVGIVKTITRGGKVHGVDTLYFFQSSIYFAEIKRIKKVFEKQAINYVFLKGLPLHLFYEGTYPKRYYSDCDLLIDKQELTKIKELFLKLGYKQDNTSYSVIHSVLKDKETAITFSKNIQGFRVIFDVHMEITFLMNQIGNLNPLYPQGLIDKLTKSFLEEKKHVFIDHERYPILSPKHHIIFLALHLFHHNFKGYYRYTFLSKIIKKRPIQTEHFLEIVDQFHLSNFIYPVLFILKKYYGTPLGKTLLVKLSASKQAHTFGRSMRLADVLEDETQLSAGVERFKLIFQLSPQFYMTKYYIFLYPAVIYSVFFALGKQLLLLINRYKNFFLYKYSFKRF